MNQQRDILRRLCGDCGRRSYFTAVHTPWYGWDVTCLRCGRSWQDGEWTPLAFRRDARRLSIQDARRRWRRAGGDGR